MEELIQLKSFSIQTTLKILLEDKTTKKNIIWATNSYQSYGEKYGERNQITIDLLDGLNSIDIQPRVLKSRDAQHTRTKKRAEVFTPKNIVKQMVDLLEENNPNCFEDETKTFLDPYMKSGLFIAELVKRLYQSKRLQELYPNKEERLKHIFEYQVYGLAPTEIIYKIATNFILGFDENLSIEKHNLKQFDAQPYTEDGTLEQKLDELFRTNNS